MSILNPHIPSYFAIICKSKVPTELVDNTAWIYYYGIV